MHHMLAVTLPAAGTVLGDNVINEGKTGGVFHSVVVVPAGQPLQADCFSAITSIGTASPSLLVTER